MVHKKTICLVTNWYPSPENPYYGSFFKEQAFAVADHFDFVVLHYREHRAVFSSGNNRLLEVNRERNTVEFVLDVKLSVWYDILNQLTDLHHKVSGKDKRPGVGKYVSKAKRNKVKKLLTKALSKEDVLSFDALYCVDAQYEAGILQVLSELTGKPYVISEHSPVPPLGLLINNQNYEAMESADLLFLISWDKARQLMMQNIHMPPTRYIGNLVDETRFTLCDKEPLKEKTILIMGANSFYKNYAHFCKVMERLCEITEVSFRILIAGYAANKGYAGDREKFECLLHSKTFSDRLELLPEVRRGETEKVYHQADVFVMTSIQEGQPLAAMEAACCGLPVFATRCGGIEDYVDDSMGRLYHVMDVEGMASGLKQFLEEKLVFDPVTIRSKVVKQYGRETFVRNFTEAFCSVMDR